MEIQLLLSAVTPCPGWVQISPQNGPDAGFNHKPVTPQGLSPGSHPLTSALAPGSAQWDSFCSKPMNMSFYMPKGFMLTSWATVAIDCVTGKATNSWVFNSLRCSLQKKKKNGITNFSKHCCQWVGIGLSHFSLSPHHLAEMVWLFSLLHTPPRGQQRILSAEGLTKAPDVRYKECHLQLNVCTNPSEFGQTMNVFVSLMPSMQSSGNATSILNLQMKLKLLKDTR